MAQTLDDIEVTDLAWVDLNTAAGITVGAKFDIALKSPSWCRLYEGAAAPALDYTGGRVLTDIRYTSNVATIPIGSLKIWALSVSKGGNLKLSVQEL